MSSQSADPRWKNVHGRVTRLDDEITEFRIEIDNRPAAPRVGCLIRVHESELATYPGAYAFTLDKMVAEIDTGLHA